MWPCAPLPFFSSLVHDIGEMGYQLAMLPPSLCLFDARRSYLLRNLLISERPPYLILSNAKNTASSCPQPDPLSSFFPQMMNLVFGATSVITLSFLLRD